MPSEESDLNLRWAHIFEGTFSDVSAHMLCFQLVAIAAQDLKRAQEFADKLNFKRAYSLYDEVAADPDVGMLIQFDQINT